MQQEVRFATFNVLNLAPPGVRFYADQDAHTQAQYDAKADWIARQLDLIDVDVIGFQEIFSQAALRDVLSRSVKYRDAHHVGFDPDGQEDLQSSVMAGTLTPSVALVSRLPVVGVPVSHAKYPHGLAVALPGVDTPVTLFTRPILHVQVSVPAIDAPMPVPGRPAPRAQTIDVLVCHLKSKRPDYRGGAGGSGLGVEAAAGAGSCSSGGSAGSTPENDSYQLGLAMLRSMIRRGAEALGLRYLISDQLRRQRLPLVVLGDFNDVAAAMTTQLVTGATSERRSLREGPTDRLFDSYRIQSRVRPLRDVGYTHAHDNTNETIDHVLVSDAFEPGAPGAIGEVLEVVYVNDHLGLRPPEASDHGIVLVRILLYGSAAGG
jgi:endonuclease/exonuclease/phosphatase family metal-dependent hydrolase